MKGKATMFPLNFEKARSQRYVECIAEGKPIGVVHSVDEMVAMAGACFFGLLSHGPLLRKAAGEMQGVALDPPGTREHAEADDAMVYADTRAAIEFVGHLTMLIRDGEYDEDFEEQVRCLLSDADGQKQVAPVQGFKNHPSPSQ